MLDSSLNKFYRADFKLVAFVEEDLEWLSNKDAFPSLDTFLSVPHRPSPPAPAGAKRPSPVSVLDGAPPPPPPSALALQWAAGRERSRGHQRRRRDLRALRGKSPEQAAHASREKRRCWHCATEETPQWRAGPEGPKTLCNACGVRYKSGRLVPEYRPASSPTFSSELHSNSHRRIMEMRRRNLEELGTAAKQG
ncbi:unnamed protein product [Spirodela intermedia]|uniref:GATA-type domain-containing protein n=1 Tax=Spirodela intermedia TaxID=51605 RepID=A0A7I8ICB2_SPIIN|nr:unnamed protein product [Spirodela intermedia]CAA6655390.1 unnamed protein product [Spirodela intermedia]